MPLPDAKNASLPCSQHTHNVPCMASSSAVWLRRHWPPTSLAPFSQRPFCEEETEKAKGQCNLQIIRIEGGTIRGECMTTTTTAQRSWREVIAMVNAVTWVRRVSARQCTASNNMKCPCQWRRRRHCYCCHCCCCHGWEEAVHWVPSDQYNRYNNKLLPVDRQGQGQFRSGSMGSESNHDCPYCTKCHSTSASLTVHYGGSGLSQCTGEQTKSIRANK